MRNKTLTKKIKEKDEMIETLKGEIFELKQGKVIPTHEFEKVKAEKDK